MIERWLVERDPERLSAVLDIQVVTADETVDEEALYDYLGHELLRNYVVPGELEAIFRDLGVPEVADHLANHKLAGGEDALRHESLRWLPQPRPRTSSRAA